MYLHQNSINKKKIYTCLLKRFKKKTFNKCFKWLFFTTSLKIKEYLKNDTTVYNF